MKFTALYPTEFYLNEGEFVAIIGPSGSGKTTFLTILGNLQEATSGEITFCGENITNLNEKRKTELRFEEFGFILQASNLIPFLKVGEDVYKRQIQGSSIYF